MNQQSNLESFIHNGSIYEGVSIGSYVGIIRGANKIICRVDKEFLEDKMKSHKLHEFRRDRFERKIELSIIGNFYKDRFEFGIKRFPMIFNEVVLLRDEEIKSILQNDLGKSQHMISIGKSVNSDINVEIAWDKIFNTHIGIFGNTGSGKSNTLAKIYTELFSKQDDDIKFRFDGKSNFVILDFNGEYAKDGILTEDKITFDLTTKTNSEKKIVLNPKFFWNIETLSILYSATEKTQKPFLKNAIKYYIDEETHDICTDSIIRGLGDAFVNTFKANNNKEMLNLLNKSLEIVLKNGREKKVWEKLQKLNG